MVEVFVAAAAGYHRFESGTDSAGRGVTSDTVTKVKTGWAGEHWTDPSHDWRGYGRHLARDRRAKTGLAS
ncbi:MAG: hypothetical protein H6645_01460 [Caldilineaceae bacterium]|nr:hypothetical protein [Caldilineaceae bacterium]